MQDIASKTRKSISLQLEQLHRYPVRCNHQQLGKNHLSEKRVHLHHRPMPVSEMFGATLAEHRAVGRKTQPAGGRPLLQSCSTTLCDDAGRRLAAPHTKFPNCDTEPSLDSLPE